MIESSERHIKEYEYWSVRLHGNQGYLGRCIIWCNREDALDLTDCTDEERDELFVIIKELKDAAEELFHPDWMNYAFLGNITRHLHGHFLPRYKASTEFAGMTFEDKRWGKNYLTDKDFITPDEVTRKIVEAYKEKLT